MKYSFKTIILLFAISALIQSGCVKEKFKVPDQSTPYANLTSNITIAQFKAHFSYINENLPPELLGDSLNTVDGLILQPIIQGIINATDESGNIYKTLYIQDNTGGLQIAIDRTSLYTTFKIGQKVYIKLSGLYVGKYGGVIQLGYIYNNDIGRLPDVLINDHIFKDGLPGATPVPLERTGVSVTGNDMNMLVKLKNVHFAEVGQVFAEKEITTNRTILDSAGTQSIVLRTSGYCNFRADLLPKGQGDIIGILSEYNGNYQLYIRDLNDIINWDSTIHFPSNIIEENFDANPPDWTIYSITSNKDWYWSSTYSCMVANGFGGDVASEDWLISPTINLTNVTNPILNFKTWTKYTDSGITNPFEVFISTDYNGNFLTATWIPLSATLSPSNSQQWQGSGDIDISSYSGNIHIGFKYRSSGTGSGTSTTWEVDAFKIKGIQN